MDQSLAAEVVSWLGECDGEDSLNILTTVMRVRIRLHERGTQEAEISNIIRTLAPLDFYTSPPRENTWNSYFAPCQKRPENETEYPCLADLGVAGLFTALIGEDVEVRRKFIEDNALDVKILCRQLLFFVAGHIS
jgi:hypothetical protein